MLRMNYQIKRNSTDKLITGRQKQGHKQGTLVILYMGRQFKNVGSIVGNC